MKLLVLDDEPWNVAWIGDFGRSFGWEVEICSTYEAAAKSSRSRVPEVAVVDVMIGATGASAQGATLANLPVEWVGLRYLRFIRAEMGLKRADTEILVYTGLDKLELEKVVERAFQSSFYPKSDVRGFRAALEKALTSRAARARKGRRRRA